MRVSGTAVQSRQAEILRHLRRTGRAEVEALATLLHTTPQTIRKDLNALAASGKVLRFHGGASLLAGVEYTAFEVRRAIAAEQKEAIGREIARRIPDNVAIFLNSGTTTAAVARHLSRHAGLLVLTDSVQMADALRVHPGLDVVVPGGTVRQSDGAILGEQAVDFVRQFRVDIAVVGAAAIGEDGSLLDFDLREAALLRVVLDGARTAILAADSSKFDRVAPVRGGHLSQIRQFVTDPACPPRLRHLCRTLGVALIEAR
ncbi:MAG: DeoR/GlpR transcriptional regulator [Rhodobacteraceae bacterium]|nr:DeoR/GlpR transcriptional regulator [Paracoccaceae bacterium]